MVQDDACKVSSRPCQIGKWRAHPLRLHRPRRTSSYSARGPTARGEGGPPARGRRRVKIFFMLLELSLSGTSTRIKLKTACRSCPERCDRHEVSAFHVSPTHHSLLVSSSSATSATARRSPQEGAEPAFSQAATVFICHPPRCRVSK